MAGHLVANTWTNVVITRTGGNFYSYYVNGRLVETYTDPNPNLPTASSASNPWTIGGRPPGGLNADLTGFIDEVAFSDQALTPDQFLDSPQAVPEPSSLTLLSIGIVVATCYGKRRRIIRGASTR